MDALEENVILNFIVYISVFLLQIQLLLVPTVQIYKSVMI